MRDVLVILASGSGARETYELAGDCIEAEGRISKAVYGGVFRWLRKVSRETYERHWEIFAIVDDAVSRTAAGDVADANEILSQVRELQDGLLRDLRWSGRLRR